MKGQHWKGWSRVKDLMDQEGEDTKQTLVQIYDRV